MFRGARPLSEYLLDIYGGASAAYSLRNLSLSYTGPAVNVRRSSDGATADFTAADVADSSLTDWVNTDVDLTLSTARSFTGHPYETFSGASSSGFYAKNTSGWAVAGFDVSGSSGESLTLTFDVTLVSGSIGILLYTAYDNVSSVSNYEQISSSGTHTVTLNSTGDFGFVGFGASLDELLEFTVSNVVITQTKSNGHVTKWYDQSGNANHAVQTTPASQPKIVENGSLLTDGVKFDGVDNFLDSVLTFTQPVSIFSTYTALTNNSPVTGSSTSSLAVSRGGSGEYVMYSGAALAGGAHPSTEVLGSCIFDGATSTGYWNGVEILSGDAGTSNDFDYLGRNTSDYFDGFIQEIIIYNSDQSVKRTGIEGNINDHYDIFADETYRRPDGSAIFRPDGTSVYERP
jgi:hypothetical protein